MMKLDKIAIMILISIFIFASDSIGVISDTDDGYRLGAGDVVKISVEDIPNLSGNYAISESGIITFTTLLEPQKVQGLTIDQFRILIEKLLAEYMYEPKITATIAEYHSHKVLLLGPFQRPGNHELKREKVSLLDIIQDVGGLREIGENDELIILRNPSNSSFSPDIEAIDDKTIETMTSIKINLQGLLRDGDLSQNVMVKAGDIIYITSFFSSNQYVYVAGGKNRGAGAIPYERGLTAFKALMRAGVVPDDPQTLELMVMHEQPNGDKFVTTKVKFDPENPGVGDIMLMPEDIVILPDKSSQVVYVAGEVNRPGVLQHKEGLTVLQAILDAGGMTKKAIDSKVKVLREDTNGQIQIPVNMGLILEKGDKENNITLLSGDIIVVPGMSLQNDIMVTGKVNNPVVIPHENGITATKAIFLSGGLSNNGLKSQIRIMKSDGKVCTPFLIDIGNGEISENNPILEPGDMLLVMGPASQNVISVLGKVRKPGIIEYSDGLTVLKAILQSGGFEQGAARSKVRIVRGEGENQQNLRADLEKLTDKNNRSRDIALVPGDIVIVGETFF